MSAFGPRAQDEACRSGRPSRVVLAPRRWRQPPGQEPGGSPQSSPEAEAATYGTAMRQSPRGSRAHRSVGLTIFWHCGHSPFSSRTTAERVSRQRTVNGFGRGFPGLKGSGNADSQRKVRSSGWSGPCRPCASGCVHAHPPYWRASASYRPLRAVWAVCAWALRGCARTPKPFSAHVNSASTQKECMQ
jgi:hypothetical protein